MPSVDDVTTSEELSQTPFSGIVQFKTKLRSRESEHELSKLTEFDLDNNFTVLK